MCGIVGILDWSGKKIDSPLIKGMTDVILHRGPDGEGIFISEQSNLGLGHRRLSIIDLSEGGRQPMSTKNNRFTITFNGEIYNYLELKADLEKKGHRFSSLSDTEVLLKLFIEYGSACLSLLDGMFAFAIWDNEKKQLFCARDRFGEKPFFYSFHKDRFVFASEIKAIFKAGIPKVVNRKRLYNYLAYNKIQSANDLISTYYDNIFELRPAHYLILDKNGKILENNSYWILKDEQTSSLSMEKATEVYLEKLQSSIVRRLRSDVAVGSSLSGGLDSSAIVLIIDQLKSKVQAQKTFSARFKDFEKDEGEFMHKAINHGKDIDPHFIWSTEDLIIEKLDNVFYHQEAPFGSPGIMVQGEIMKLAKENDVTVLLDGQGADEVLGGYHYFYDLYLQELYRTDKSLFAKERNAIENMHNKIFGRGKSFYLNAKFPKTAFYLKAKFKNDSRKLSLHSGFVNSYGKQAYPLTLRTTLQQALKDSTTVIGLSELLNYADRNSMAYSREIRLPFLSHELVEFVFSLPSHQKIHMGWTKYILRKAVEKIVPAEIVWRKDKIGYMPPVQKWLNDKRVTECVQDSISFLKKEKIIAKPIASQSWQYLMADRLLRNDL